MHDRSRILESALTALTPFLAAALMSVAAARAAHGIVLPPFQTWLALLALAVLAESFAVPLVAGGYVSLAALVQLPVMVLFGPIPAALAGAAGVAVVDTIHRRGRISRVFNPGQRALTVLLAGYAWNAVAMPGHWLAAPLAWPGDRLAAAALVSIAVYAAGQAVLVSLRLAVVRGERLRYVLTHSGVWQASTSAALGAAGIALALFVSGGLTQREAGLLAPLLIAGVAALLLAVRRHAAQEAAAFHGAVGDLLGTLEPGGVLDRLADRVVRIARPDALWIAVRAPDGGYAIALARGVTPQQAAPLAAGIIAGAADDALSQRRTLAVWDYAREPRRRQDIAGILGGGRVRSSLTVPLAAGAEALGVLTLVKDAPGAFTAPQQRLIATLATLAALALHNAGLYDATRRAVARKDALQQVARAAAAGVGTTTIQQLIVDLATETLGCARGVLAHYDDATGTLVAAAFRNISDDALRLRPAITGTGWRTWTIVEAVRRARPVATVDTLDLPGAPAALPANASRAVAAAPMMSKDRVVGAVVVGRDEVHAWTPDELDLLQAFANEGAVAIDNVRLSDATRAQLQRMGALETISERINSEHDVNAVFELIADSARDVLGADRCGIFLGEPGRHPTHVFSRGLSDEYVAVAAGTVAAGLGAASAVMSRREPVVITDVDHDPLGEPVRQAAAKVGYRTVALFPLLYRDGVTGVLRLYHDRVRPYAQADIALGAAFANQAAIAVENARLLDGAERRARELALLNRVMGRVTTALRPEELFETLVEELHATLHYPLVALLTLTDDGTALRVVSRRGYVGDIPMLVPIERGIVGRVARTGVAILSADVAAERDYLTVDSRVRQEVCVPIFVEGRVVGVINVETADPVLGRSDVDLLTALAGEVSSALRNAVLFAEVRSARDEIQALHEAAQMVSASLELSAVLESLVKVTCRRFGYDRSAILLADDRGGLEVRAACGAGHTLGTRIPAWEGAEGQAARDRRPVLISAAAGDGGPIETTLALPLVREGQLVGVFSVGTADADRLGDRARHTLTTLAGYAMVAIENARLYEQTRHLAATDGLTGLANHRAFIQALDQELERSRRYALPLSMIMIEIDRFKRYNDTYGHLRGDDVLRMVARTLEREHRKQIDFVARYGGDEFIILLPHTPRAVAADVAERIRRTVEDTPFIVGRDIASITISLGVASFPEDGDTTITLIEAADRRMYAVKQEGGNAVAATTS
ncbi:MAG TPA: GAF domain-containing protein [bacterium]|nr:GAF domain-containing protein [bacterium]